MDIWACGVTLFNMFSGSYPFDGDKLMQLFENITSKPVQWPPLLSRPGEAEDLQLLLKGMLEKEPENRFNSVTVRASAWFGRSFQVVSATAGTGTGPNAFGVADDGQN